MDWRNRITGKLRDLVATPIERGVRDAVVIAIASSKGGVGKTTTAVNLSVALARSGNKTLLLDLDPQAHVAASLQAFPPPHEAQLSDVLLGRLREVCEVAYPFARQDKLHIDLSLAGSDKQLAETEMVLSAKIGKELILDGAMEITRSHYDVIVVDCPPNLGTLTLNALCCADKLLVPSDMSILALEGVTDILAALDTVRRRLGRGLELAGILPTRVDARSTRTNASIMQGVSDLHGDQILRTAIPQSSDLNKAHMAGKSIFEFKPRSPGALAYAQLAEELGERVGFAQIVAVGAQRSSA